MRRFYGGQLSKRPMHAFVLQNIPSPISDLDAATLEWWLAKTLKAGHKAVVYLVARDDYEVASPPLTKTHRLARALSRSGKGRGCRERVLSKGATS